MTPRVLWGARFVLFAVASGAALLGIAMWLYPGGTAMDPEAPGHSFWLNFLSDLTEPVARNGAANRGGSALARAGMFDLALGLGAVWLLVPVFLEDQRRAARAIRGAGVLCAVALIAVPLAPGVTHMVPIFTSAAAGLTAGIVTIVAFARSGGPPHRWLLMAAVLAATAVAAVFYAQSLAAHPRVVRPEVPAAERVGSLLALAWMVVTALEILRARRAPARARERP
jgi:hypothetical protein